MRPSILFLALLAGPAAASAADWEAAAWLGPAFPFYTQKFEYQASAGVSIGF